MSNTNNSHVYSSASFRKRHVYIPTINLNYF